MISQLTVLVHDIGCGFDIVTSKCGKLEYCEGLNYDEMVGMIARLLCPHESVGKGYMGRPLFLVPPKDPDACGDNAPDMTLATKPGLVEF